MAFTTHGPKLMGNLASVFFKTDDGHAIPVLNLIQGEGDAMKPEHAQALAENITGILNGGDPETPLALAGTRLKWSRLSSGMNVVLQKSPDLRDKSGVLLMFAKSCPPDMVARVSDRLAEQNGLASVLRAAVLTNAVAAARPVHVPPSFHQR